MDTHAFTCHQGEKVKHTHLKTKHKGQEMEYETGRFATSKG